MRNFIYFLCFKIKFIFKYIEHSKNIIMLLVFMLENEILLTFLNFCHKMSFGSNKVLIVSFLLVK